MAFAMALWLTGKKKYEDQDDQQLINSFRQKGDKKAQHVGIGSELIKEAEKIAKKNGFEKISVISSIGTRQYYQKKGYN